MGAMQQRVQCRGCRCHRDLRIAPRCLVCGQESFDPVEATAGDLDAITLEVIAAAEALDLALHDGVTVTKDYYLAGRLRTACRARALAKAGILSW